MRPKKATASNRTDQFTARGFMLMFNSGELRIYNSGDLESKFVFLRADSGVNLPLNLKIHPKGALSIQIISDKPCVLEASGAKNKARKKSQQKR